MAASKPTPLQQAFHVIRDLESRVFSLTAEPIAILGMACRLPGSVASPEEFWRLLSSGQDATSELTSDRFDVDAFYDPDPGAAGKMYTRRAGLLDAIDGFDARFFGISPREAILLDPQQRLLLEVTWEALERAGLPPDRLEHTPTGVFIAASPSDYARLPAYTGELRPIEVYDGTGNATCFTAGRISYVLGLEGPCFAVDTACSSSLLAVHLACQSLRAGECDVAIAGGVSLIACPETFIFLSRAGNISRDGRSRTFDAAADGYGRGEGSGAIVLKRLSRARADGDPILAVVRGSAVNHGGASSGLTVPNGLAQQAVIRRACRSAGIEPRQLTYVEAHGTATLLGDPIELDALGAIAAGRSEDQPLWVGSVKSNVGHLEAAAGIAGLIKAVLMLQHQQIPPNLHFTQPNPHVDWQHLPLRVPTQLTAWDAESPRLAGISSFGLSGTNVHAILEEAPTEPSDPAVPAAQVAPAAPAEPLVLAVSARSPAALRALAAAMRDRLAADEELPIAAVAHTAALRRSHHAHRIAVTGATREAWIAALEAFAGDAAHPGLFAGRGEPGGRLAFVCSGQGSQWVGMGRALYAASDVVRDGLRAAAAALAPHGGYPVLDAFSEAAAPPDLTCGEIVQPLLFAVQVALARLWRAWGIEPAAVTGHSVGEIAAAHISGALGLDDAARIVAVRSELLARIRDQGGMAMIELPVDETEAWLARVAPELAVAGINAPRTTVVSGPIAAIDALLDALAGTAVFARRVKIDVASHSPQVAPLVDELRARLAGIRPQDAAIPLFSTVTGGEIAGRALDADYWARNLRQPVRFADAVAGLDRAGYRAFLEISPHPIVAVAIEQTVGPRVIAGSLRRGRGDLEALGESLALLYASGTPVDWHQIYRSAQPCVPLPTYPWQRERYWTHGGGQPAGMSGALLALAAAEPARSWAGQRLHSPGEEAHYIDHVTLADHPYLEDHRIFDDVVVPGAFHLAAVLAVAPDLVGSERCVLTSVSFPRALTAGRPGAPPVHLTALPRAGAPARFRRASRATSGEWTDHATGFIARADGSPEDAWLPSAAASAALTAADPTAFYERNAGRGIALGPQFRWIRALWIGERQARAILERPAALPAAADPAIHPAQLDAVFQTFAAAVPDTADHAYIPFSIDRLEVCGAADEPWRCFARYHPGDLEFLVGDAVVLGADYRVIMRVTGLRLKRVSRAALAGSRRPAWSDWLYETRWDRADLPTPAAASPAPSSRRWLVIAGAHGVVDRLTDRLAARGDTCVTLALGDAPVQPSGAAPSATPVPPFDAVASSGSVPFSDAVASSGSVPFSDAVASAVASSGPVPPSYAVASAVASSGPVPPSDVVASSGPVPPSDAVPNATPNAIIRRDDLDRLARALAASPTDVVVLSGLAGPPADELLTWPRARAARVAAGLLHTVQAITAAALRDPPRVSVVTRGTQRVGDVHPVDVVAAQLWGMARSLAHEHPALGLSRIDLDPALGSGVPAAKGAQTDDPDRPRGSAAGTGDPDGAAAGAEAGAEIGAEAGAEIDQLVAELVARDREDEVGFRGGHRHVARLAHAPRLAVPGRPPVRGDASYLITGGLGGLGLRLAAWLVEAGARHLVLVGRRGADTAAQRDALRAFEASGAEVEVVPADVADRAALARAVARAVALAPLGGVIHAAGLVDDGLVDRQTVERLHRVLAPKAEGALHLHALTRDRELDFFVLFSSAAALIGAPGQSNYAAANAVLDALALDRRARGLPALSVNWGAFAEVGMAAAQAHRGDRLAHRGVLGMSPADGLAALAGLLAGDATQAAVVSLDPRQWLESSPHLARAPRFAELVRDARPASPTRAQARDLDGLREAPPKERRSRLAGIVRQQIGLVLRLDGAALDLEAPLMSLGFDSLLSLELRNHLERLLGLTLPATLLWTYPTIERLTEHLADQLGPQGDAATGPGAGAAAAHASAGHIAAVSVIAAQASASAIAPTAGADELDLDRLSDAEKARLEQQLAKLVSRL